MQAPGKRPLPVDGTMGQPPRQVCKREAIRRACLVAKTTSTGAYPNQAFSYGAAIAVQFHPEITYAQVHRWTGHNNSRLGMKGAHARLEHIEGHIHHAPKVHAWLDRFLRRWVAAELTID